MAGFRRVVYPQCRFLAARLQGREMTAESTSPTQPNPYSATHEELQPVTSSTQRGTIAVILLAGALVLIVAVTVTAVLAFVAGGIAGQEGLYRARAAGQAAKIRHHLNQQGQRYADLTIEQASDGWSYLTGTVSSQQDLDDLRAEMQRLFGEELGAEMTASVEVEQPSAAPGAEGE